MRIVLVLLFLSLLVSTRAYTQETFECHVKNAPFQKVLDIIREQTGCTFFFQSEPRLPYSRVTMDEKKISVDDFLQKYLGVAAADYRRDRKSYFIKRKEHSAFGSNIKAPLAANPPSAEQKDAAEFKDEVLPGVTVIPISNGYQRIPKERSTGSFGFIDRTLINRTVSTSLNDRIENITPGLLSNHGQSVAGIPIRDMPQIRSLSTIYANAAPLYVLDNFPYDGDINNINPNDIEYITVLKDAAASSIWGVRAGNGVIIINTRKSKLSDSIRTFQPVFSYTSSVTYQARPDMNNISHISSADFIEREKDLFKQDYYMPFVTTPVTPVVSLLTDVKNSLIDSITADKMIESMKSQDVYRDISKYFYKGSINQQHYLQASAATTNAAHYFSAGWDHNLYNLSGMSYDRITMRLQNIFRLNKSLTVETGVNFIHNSTRENGNPGYNYQSAHGYKNFYPYARFTDAQGQPASVSLDYSPDYLQAASQLGFLNWTYTPIKDMQTEQNINKLHDLLINVGGRYFITPSLNVEVKYQYENGGASGSDLHDASSYYVRDLINSFTQVDPATNKLSYPVLKGGILDLNTQETIAHQGRVQVNFNHTWDHKNNLNAIAGYEIKSLVSSANFNKEYAYDPEDGSYDPHTNFSAQYTSWQQFNPTFIPNHAPLAQQTDHFLGYYLNASYTYDNRYTLSASGREDAANLFGVNTNNKTVPLLSGGIAWQINNEHFYHVDWLPVLKLRATYGRNGNISRLASAYTTATYSQGGVTGTPYRIGYIQGLSNPNLRWERVGMLNLGLDFAINKIITGSVEYYKKHANDLIGAVPANPTLGLVEIPGQPGYYYANSATMNGSGVDLQLEARILRDQSPSALRWTVNFIFSKATSKVQNYLRDTGVGNEYLNQYAVNPLPGRPVYAVYSYKWKGLDNTGDPMGYDINGKPSKDWTAIYNNTPIDSMVYNGPSQPTVFGALRNTFEWRHFRFSFNVSYKFGYYFRRPSISYTDLFAHWTGSGDYAKRWQHAGDEEKTIVPKAGDPTDLSRDLFYINSSALVEKADHIRLEDIVISYDLNKKDHNWLPFQSVRIYNYLSNLGLLWKANKSGIDPYYINIPKDGRRYSIGINVNF